MDLQYPHSGMNRLPSLGLQLHRPLPPRITEVKRKVTLSLRFSLLILSSFSFQFSSLFPSPLSSSSSSSLHSPSSLLILLSLSLSLCVCVCVCVCLSVCLSYSLSRNHLTSAKLANVFARVLCEHSPDSKITLKRKIELISSLLS